MTVESKGKLKKIMQDAESDKVDKYSKYGNGLLPTTLDSSFTSHWIFLLSRAARFMISF